MYLHPDINKIFVATVCNQESINYHIIMIILTIRWYHAIDMCIADSEDIMEVDLSLNTYVHAHLLCASPHWRLSRMSTTYVLKKYFIAVLICQETWVQLPCASITLRLFFCPSSRFLSATAVTPLTLARYRSPFYAKRFGDCLPDLLH